MLTVPQALLWLGPCCMAQQKPPRTLCRSYVATAAAFRLKKHSRQYTGRPWVGLKGTVVSRPHWEQVVVVSDFVNPDP